MAACANCGTTILFGGVKDGDFRYCNESCHQGGLATQGAAFVPAELVNKRVKDIHRGNCPVCQRTGPVDVHTSYTIVSLIVVTQWNSKPTLCCRSCGRKRQLGAFFSSALVGWWGFPWGILGTPIYLVLNLVGMIGGPSAHAPSDTLKQIVKAQLGSEVAQYGTIEPTEDELRAEQTDNPYAGDAPLDLSQDAPQNTRHRHT